MWDNISVLLFLEKLYYFSSLLILIFSNANKSIFTLEMLIFRYSDSIYVRMIRHSVSVPIVSSEYIYFSQLVLFKSVFQNFSVVFFFFWSMYISNVKMHKHIANCVSYTLQGFTKGNFLSSRILLKLTL